VQDSKRREARSTIVGGPKLSSGTSVRNRVGIGFNLRRDGSPGPPFAVRRRSTVPADRHPRRPRPLAHVTPVVPTAWTLACAPELIRSLALEAKSGQAIFGRAVATTEASTLTRRTQSSPLRRAPAAWLRTELPALERRESAGVPSR